MYGFNDIITTKVAIASEQVSAHAENKRAELTQ